MVPIVMLALAHSVSHSHGKIIGSDARVHIMNRRWRVVPEVASLDNGYEWELQSRSSAFGSPFKLKIFMENGVEISRDARCPLFLTNYISLDSRNWEGVDEIFRDNTIYFLNATTCVLQNTWFTGVLESKKYGPYFLNVDVPLMRSVEVKQHGCI
jgi:hypothetical protein